MGPAAIIDRRIAQGYSLHMDAQSEQILLAQARQGDEVSFEQLVLAHSSRVLNLAYRLVGDRDEAEDIAQEAFLRLHSSLSTFRGDSSVGTWLYRTVSHLSIDRLRREKLKRKIFFFRRAEEDSIDPVETVASVDLSPVDQVLGGEIGAEIKKALEKLSPRQKAVFVLRHQEEMPLKEIAATLGMSEGTVKAHLHRAVTLLRKELKEVYGERT